MSRRVLVRHPEPIVALGLATALGALPGWEVSLDAGCAPDVLVCGAEGHGVIDDADVRRVLLARQPRGFEIRSALAAGVLGYLATECSLGELEAAVQSAAAGIRFLCRRAAREMADVVAQDAMSGRERQVLHLLAQGASNKAIANALDIALGTAKAHVRSIMTKLDAQSRTEAASLAARRGLLLDPGAEPDIGRRDVPWQLAAASRRAALPAGLVR